MRIEEIQKMADEDLKIDEHNLESESINTPALYNKYLKLFTQESYKYKSYEQELRKIYKQKYEHYKVEHSIALKDSEIANFVKGDDEYIEVEQKLIMAKEKVQYIESILKQLTQKTYHIKNAIEYIKFKNGLI